ncbi:MAG: DsrE/DsrF/DrsH-like family protein, partial [Staphylococcus sp.]|nr:DsrE/DsrF/DrsH-like family protein [Staphylococcus sp.]
QYKTKHINDFTKKELQELGSKGQLIDVRQPEEYELGHIKNALLHSVENIENFKQDRNKTYYIYCKSGNRSRKASQFLTQRGYNVVNLDGGYTAYEQQHNNESFKLKEDKEIQIKHNRKTFNYSNLQCPGPIVNISKEMKNIAIGDQIEVVVTDHGFLNDIKSWVKQTGHTLVRLNDSGNEIRAIIQKEENKNIEVTHTKNGTTIVLFNGELDKAVAAMIIANGAKAAGRDVTIFCTFWGLNALKKTQSQRIKKKGIAKLFDFMLPNSPIKMPISKMNMFGVGNLMMRYVMKKKNVDDLPSLINQAVEQGVKLIACTMSMDVMGITKEELRDDVEYGGVGAYIGYTEQANHNLFI